MEKITKKELRNEAKEFALLLYDIFQEISSGDILEHGQNHAKQRKEQ